VGHSRAILAEGFILLKKRLMLDDLGRELARDGTQKEKPGE
jgi:hypothetical protein